MIGVYDYTVIATYLSLIASVAGILMTVNGHPVQALCCLLLSGLLDTVDGKIARTKKDRTRVQKEFGIQIDSLCDLVCFGVLPALTGYVLGFRGAVGFIVAAGYILCALIRLAWFNVLEEETAGASGKKPSGYTGLPVTSAALLMPAAFLVGKLFPGAAAVVYDAVLAGTALAFVLPFHVGKPKGWKLAALVIIGCAEIVLMALCAESIL